jgi:hypothetical protein
MSIVRAVSGALAGLAAAVIAATVVVAGQQPAGATATTHQMGMGGGTMTREQKIADALTAAPGTVTAKATILDWP